MAKQIIWSSRAKADLKDILQYWVNRTKSKTYSKKLNLMVHEAVEIIKAHPQIGHPTNYLLIHSKLVRDYCIFYEETPDAINILSVWDSRRDEKNLKLR